MTWFIEYKNNSRLRRLLWHNNSPQTNKWVLLPVLVKSKTRKCDFLAQFGLQMTLLVRLVSMREWLSETETNRNQTIMFDCDWESLCQKKIIYCHVAVMYQVLLENRFVLCFLKRWVITKTHMDFFRLASAIAHGRLRSGCRNLGKIISKPTFFVLKRPSHLTLCIKLQLATNKEYILNRYHNRSSERKVPFTSIKTGQLFLLLFDTRVHANGAKNYL